MKTIYKVMLITVLSLWAVISCHFILYTKSTTYRDKFNEIFKNEVVEDPYHDYIHLLAKLSSYYDIYWENVQEVATLDKDDPQREIHLETIADCVEQYNKVTSENPDFLKHDMFLKYLPNRLSPFDEISESQLFDYLAYKVRYLYYSYMGLYEEYRLNTIEDYMIDYLIQQKEEYNNLLEQYHEFALSNKFPPGFPTKIKDEIVPIPSIDEQVSQIYTAII